MLRHYAKVALRQLLRHRRYAGIMIGGLALSMAAYLLITDYVRFETTFDRIHPAGERIYRVESQFFKGGQLTDDWATSSNGYGSAMQAAFPELEATTRISWRNSARTVRYEQTKFRENHVCYADSNFFTFFAFPVRKGDPRTFLKAPNTIVISEAAARRYFRSADPIGRYLDIRTTGQTLRCQVTGVFADLPPNATMQFDMLMSWTTQAERLRNFWYQHETYTFVRLRPGASPRTVEAKFPALSETYKTQEALRDYTWAVQLVPLHDLHLNPAKGNEVEVKGNRRAVQWLWAMSFVILIIGWANYMNLSTARALDRAREVGIRKAVGSANRWLLLQFLFEALLVNGLALALAVGLKGLFRGLMTSFLQMETRLETRWVGDWDLTTAGLQGLLLITGALLSGLYPAFVLAGIKPSRVLKGAYRFSATGAWLRKGLVVAQFTASMVLIVVTFVAYRQLSFMLNQELGVQIEQVLVLRTPVQTDNYAQKTVSFKEELKRIKSVRSVTASGAVPGKEVGQVLANRLQGARPGDDRPFETLTVDYDFIRTFDLKLIAGRGFDRDRPADQRALVLNESAVRHFGFTSPEQAIGRKVLLEVTPERPNEIIGVIKDYHQQALQRTVTPVILLMDPDYSWLPTEFYSLRLASGEVDGVVTSVQALWQQFFPESSLDYFFLDDFYNQQYRQDRQFGRSFLLFAALAIGIACMGLFGLTLYSTARRTREIGIRKVLGATSLSVVGMLAWDILRLILVAVLLAVPISWYLVDRWLAGYAFRIDVNLWHWLLPGLLLAVIALLTVGWTSVKAARANPTNALRMD